VFGDGPYRSALHFTRRDLGLERYVELRSADELRSARSGDCPDLQRQLEWCDVVLDASLSDPPSASLAAARAAGVPVITTSAQVNPGEPQAIAHALAAMAAERVAELELMGSSGCVAER
jgi:glycosyltransferase involved in cell wall biosynthesis